MRDARFHLGFIGCLAMIALTACGGGSGGGGGGNAALEKYEVAGVFSIQKPKGWEVITAGNCETLGVLLRLRRDRLQG
jgi:hypothetical protein